MAGDHRPMCAAIVDCRSVLQGLSFGQRIAEEERDNLARYFVETDQWRRVSRGEVDIVYGPKGSGKSALYFLLLDRKESFAGNNVTLITAENPRGTPVFSDLKMDPPANEREFTNLWKLYLLSLLGRTISERKTSLPGAEPLIERLTDAGLLESVGGLKALLRAVRDYIRRFNGFEGGINFDTVSGTPSGVTGKILFELPSSEHRRRGVTSVDELFELANKILESAGEYIWILLDRLDVAFAETSDLEQNALRALFKTYLDLLGFERFRLKIFLRSDIWSRLTQSGFREASHITRTTTISWN